MQPRRQGRSSTRISNVLNGSVLNAVNEWLISLCNENAGRRCNREFPFQVAGPNDGTRYLDDALTKIFRLNPSMTEESVETTRI
jgi:hypothetical protein